MIRTEVLKPAHYHPGLWLGRNLPSFPAVPTGHAELDEILPGGGWPLGGLSELFSPAQGIGEFDLLMPAIARLTQEGKRVALVAPPYLPYSQALADRGVQLSRLVLLSPRSPEEALWAAEQSLKSGSFGMVVAWPARATEHDLRKLQLAAEAGDAVAVLYRPARDAIQSSPACLRIVARPEGQSKGASLRLQILKSRGGQPAYVRLQLAEESSRLLAAD